MEEMRTPHSAGETNGDWDTAAVTTATLTTDMRPTIEAVLAQAATEQAEGAPLRFTEHPDGSTTMEAVQPTIPGLRPPFDIAAAMTMIEEQERAASRAEADC